MNSLIKSWLYAGMLEKLDEIVMVKPRDLGGLGVHHIKSKAMAIQIKSFMETAVNPKFISNLYHSTLFKWHVLEDESITNPGKPPFYSNAFFLTIKEAMRDLSLSTIRMMSSSQ